MRKLSQSSISFALAQGIHKGLFLITEEADMYQDHSGHPHTQG